MAELRGSFSFIRDPQGEAERLAFERQVNAGQICSAEDRAMRERCAEHDEPGRMRRHDPGHCDRAWAAREASDAPG